MNTRHRTIKGLLGLLLCCALLLGLVPGTAETASAESRTYRLVTSIDDLNHAGANYLITGIGSDGTRYALTFDSSNPDIGNTVGQPVGTPYTENGQTYLSAPAAQSPYAYQMSITDFSDTHPNVSGAARAKVRVSSVNPEYALVLWDGYSSGNGTPMFKQNSSELTLNPTSSNTWQIWRGTSALSSSRALTFNTSNNTFSVGNHIATSVEIWTDDGVNQVVLDTYTRIADLGNLVDFDATTEFLFVLPIDGQRYVMSRENNSDTPATWLAEVSGDGDIVMVDSSKVYVFHVYDNFTPETYHGVLRMSALNGIQANTGSYIRTQNGGTRSAPLGSATNKRSYLTYGTGENSDTIFLRGNGQDTYLGNQASGFATVAEASENQWQPIEIYAKVEDTRTAVDYLDNNGNVASTVYVKDSFLLKDSLPNVTHNGAEYIFVGWSTDARFAGNPYLSLAESCNLYDYDVEEFQNSGVENTVKAELREKYSLLGLCSVSFPSVVSLSDLKGQTKLYPVYAVKGYDTVVSAKSSGMKVVGISRNVTDEDINDSYKWLGSVDVEIFLDGEPWGSSTPMYFRYHNDNSVDLNLKFILASLANAADDSAALLDFMEHADDNSEALYPRRDPTDQYVIDAVYVKQSHGESGLFYKNNWLTEYGGRLDNVQGGSTVQVYVTSKYQVKYYLDDVEIGAAAWQNANTYTTSETRDAFHAKWTEARYQVSGRTSNATLLSYETQDGTFDGEGDAKFTRGNYFYFAYEINEYPHVIPVALSPESQVKAPNTLVSTEWTLKNSGASKTSAVAWGADYTVAASNKDMAYREAGQTVGPKTYHLYAYTAAPTGTLTVTKSVTGDDGETERSFHFTVTLSGAYTDADGATADASKIAGAYGDMTFINGAAQITLKHGETKTATGLPTGVTYAVAETEADSERYVTTSTGATGAITEGKTAAAIFVNHRDPEEEEIPQTGDNSQLGLWLALMLAALTGMVVLAAQRKRR